MQKNKKKGLIKVINKTEEWTKDELEILKSTSKNESGQKLIRLLPSKQLISIFQKKERAGYSFAKTHIRRCCTNYERKIIHTSFSKRGL